MKGDETGTSRAVRGSREGKGGELVQVNDTSLLLWTAPVSREGPIMSEEAKEAGTTEEEGR